MSKRRTLSIFLLISAFNVIIFLFRDHFSYEKKGTYSSLYAADNRKWRQFIADIPDQDLQEAHKILDTAVNIGNISAGRDKILAIGNWLYKKFDKQKGLPSPLLNNVDPFAQYKLLSSSDTLRLWCGHFANMFALFCWAEGISCRVIELMNPGDHHVVNECYLSETREWVMVDVTTNHLLMRNGTGNKFLSLQEATDSLSPSLQCLRSTDSSIMISNIDLKAVGNYYKSDNAAYYYYRTDYDKMITTPEKIKRYFLPVGWYEVVSKDHRSNVFFYIKAFFSLAWVILFLILLYKLFK